MTNRAAAGLLACCALVLSACETTTPDDPLDPSAPSTRIFKVDLERLTRELPSDVGLLGHRLGERPSAAPARPLHGVLVDPAEARPDTTFSPGCTPVACYVIDGINATAAKVFAGDEGTVDLLAVFGSSPYVEKTGELAYLSSTVALYRMQDGSRGATYWQRRGDGTPQRTYTDPYVRADEGFVAFAGPPPARYFPGVKPVAAWLEELEGPPLAAARVALAWFHAPMQSGSAELNAWLDRRGGEAFAAALEAGEHDLATRLLAYWDARRFKLTFSNKEGHDAERLRQLVAAGDMGGYARYAQLRGSDFRLSDLGVFGDGDSSKIVFNFWRTLLALEASLAKGEWPREGLQQLFRFLEIGVPQHYPEGGKQIHLSSNHDQRIDRVTMAAARILYASVGEAAYPDRLAEALALTSRFEGRRRQELFFDSLGLATRIDALALRQEQLREELEAAWRDPSARGQAVVNYLERVRGTFAEADAAAFEQERRAVLTRLAADPAAYEDLVVILLKAPRTEDPHLLDWLPAALRGPIVDRLRAQAAREERIDAIKRDLNHLIDFEHRPRELEPWSFWARASVRDGRDAPRFEAAERGAEALREYVRALDAAGVDPRTRWRADGATRSAYERYIEHYGPEAFALFVALPVRKDADALRLALRTMDPEPFADAMIAFKEGHADAPAPATSDDPYRAARAFCELARRYFEEPRRAQNRVIALLQGRTLRQHAKAYMDKHGDEAYLGCLLPLALDAVDDVELVNEWCNHGVAKQGMIRDFLQRGTILFEAESGTFDALTLEGPALLTRYGDLFALRPRGSADVGGAYRYSARLRVGGRALTAEGTVTVSPPPRDGPLRHRTVRQTLTAPP